MTFIYVTHDQEEALTMSDRLAVFNQGKIEQIGTPAEMYEHPATQFVAGFIGTSNILERDGRTFTVRPEKIRLLTGVADDGEQGTIIAVKEILDGRPGHLIVTVGLLGTAAIAAGFAYRAARKRR